MEGIWAGQPWGGVEVESLELFLPPATTRSGSLDWAMGRPWAAKATAAPNTPCVPTVT